MKYCWPDTTPARAAASGMADRLPGSGTDPLTGQPAKAGLFVPAKSERHAYGKPGAGTSALGLDKLAAAKVAERGAMPPPGMQPASKRPRETRLDHLHEGEAEGGAEPRDKQFRKPREPTPSHSGGVNEEARAKIIGRVRDRIKGGDGQQFSTRGGAGGDGGRLTVGSAGGHVRAAGGARGLEPPSPARSELSSADWERHSEPPSPRHPGSVYDGRAMDSEPRAIVADTPLLGGGAGGGSSVSRSHL